MVSAKMYELGTKKSTIRTIFEFGRNRAAEVGEENIFDFSLGNPNVPTPDFVRDAAIDILQTYEPAQVHGYTVAPGNPQVREILAQSINARFGTHFAGKNLFVTSGAAAAITICFKALAEPGDEFITFAPYFPEYKVFVESVGAELKVVKPRPEDWQIDFDDFYHQFAQQSQRRGLFKRNCRETRRHVGVSVQSLRAAHFLDLRRALSRVGLRRRRALGHRFLLEYACLLFLQQKFFVARRAYRLYRRAGCR